MVKQPRFRLYRAKEATPLPKAKGVVAADLSRRRRPMATPSAAAKSQTRVWVLQAETELRFDVSSEHTLTVVVRYRYSSSSRGPSVTPFE